MLLYLYFAVWGGGGGPRRRGYGMKLLPCDCASYSCRRVRKMWCDVMWSVSTDTVIIHLYTQCMHSFTIIESPMHPLGRTGPEWWKSITWPPFSPQTSCCYRSQWEGEGEESPSCCTLHACRCRCSVWNVRAETLSITSTGQWWSFGETWPRACSVED